MRSGEPDWSRWRRPGPTPTERRRDVLVALAVLVGAFCLLVFINSTGTFAFGDAPSLTEQLAWGAALAVPLAVRRTYPLAVMVVVSVLFIGAQVRHIGDNNTPSVALFIVVFTVGAWERNRVVARWSRIGVIALMSGYLGVTFLHAMTHPPRHYPGAAGPLDPFLAAVLFNILINTVYFVIAYGFGNMAWLSARRQAELEYRAEQLRRSQEQNTRGAIVAERLRIARDLHDVVAHYVSVMGVQAGAARRALDRDPDFAREALRTVEQTARTAIGELRGLLGVLRAEDAEQPAPTHSSSPGLDEVAELVASARAAGLSVRHGVAGEPRPVSDGVALSAYRVVQEALTNVVKHAGARSAEVRERYLANALEVEVTDDGRGHDQTEEGGFGLVGMRERIAVHGGELEAGPRRDAGYRVRATLPTARGGGA
ncbi:sensor histidine kinase [Actinophytocola sp.]|uniref:sensor histidine kinase n=1 Tax=Actinophytocola sp. TaxID=1872138 RepID=UPI00389A899F